MTRSAPHLRPALESLAATLDHLAPVEGESRALEPTLEALYAGALSESRSALVALEVILSRWAGHSTIDVWRSLIHLYLARRKATLEALHDLKSRLASAPPRSRWLAGAEAARIVARREGAAIGWSCAESLTPFMQDDARSREGPMVLSAVLTWLNLAGTAGEWGRYNALASVASTYWTEGSASSVRIGLLLADQAIARGRFKTSLDQLDRLEEVAQGNLLAHLLCSRLHALAALGKGRSARAGRTYRALLRALRGPCADEHSISVVERRALQRRADRIACQSGLISKSRGQGGLIVTQLLGLEQKARGMRRDPVGKVQLLFDILDRADAALQRSRAAADIDGWLRLRLLRCRILVDLAAHDTFADCEAELGKIYDEAERCGLLPLMIQALDQRAVVRGRSSDADWGGALKDSSRASAMVVELLAANAGPPGSSHMVERALLEDYLPVLDRVIELHVEGASRLASRHPELVAEPIRSYHDALEAETPEGSWVRFGRTLHAYAEQTQALALREARRAYSDTRAPSRHIAITHEGSPRVVVNELLPMVPRREGMLQYFVVGGHVLIFLFLRGSFDWHLMTVPGAGELAGPERAHTALKRIIDGVRAFSRGEDLAKERALVKELHDVILPLKIEKAIGTAGLSHLRIVPHDVLYRAPFGKVKLGSMPLVQRFSMSIHPTGRMALVVSAPRGPTGRGSIGHVIGPAVAWADDEARAIQKGAGGLFPFATVLPIRTGLAGLAAFRERAGDHDILHFTCHGTEGDALSPPVLVLGTLNDDKGEGTLSLADASTLSLRNGVLVVLQSCWTGWMDHERKNSVQGFPQAFCDAGADAVIAPLVPLPEALAPLFSAVLYRALRFLPAEKALQRTLDVLRTHGRALVSGNQEACAMLDQHGSLDAFEIRYTGATGVRFGKLLSRFVGRVSFWWWRRWLPRNKPSHASLTTGEASGVERLESGL